VLKVILMCCFGPWYVFFLSFFFFFAILEFKLRASHLLGFLGRCSTT
jgi:hypothetical protein